MAGIEHAQKLLADVAKLAQDAIEAVKGGKFAEIKGVFKILGDLKDAVVDLKAALPELKDLDGTEGAALASSAYDLVKNLLAQLPH